MSMDEKFWELYNYAEMTKEHIRESVEYFNQPSLKPFVDENGEEFYWLDRDGLQGVEWLTRKGENEHRGEA